MKNEFFILGIHGSNKKKRLGAAKKLSTTYSSDQLFGILGEPSHPSFVRKLLPTLNLWRTILFKPH
jgi:hypothetical protein